MRTSIRAAALAVALLLIASACGGDDDDDDASGSGSGDTETTAEAGDDASGATLRGITDTEIKVGGLSSVTSPTGGGFPGTEEGARARFERENREGGIHGRTINYIGTEDDGEDSTRNLDLARSLVEQDEVFAIIPATSAGFLPQSTDYLNEQQVPFLGWGFVPGYCGTTWGFGFNGCLISTEVVNTSLAGTMIQATDLPEGSSVAISTNDTDFSQAGAEQWRQAFESFGMNAYVSETLIPLASVTDYTPYATDLMTSNDGGPPDFIYLNPTFGNAVGMSGALKAAGYEGFLSNATTYVPGDFLATSPDVATALDGSYVLIQFLPQEAGGPIITEMEDDLEAIGEEPFISLGAAVGYWSADLFVAMLEATGEDLSVESFDAAINEGDFVYTSEGVGTVPYPESHDVPAPCSAVVQIVGTEYEMVSDGIECFENIPAQ